MKRATCFFFIFFLFLNNVVGQNFVGSVSNYSNKPVVGATIFIKELSQGLSCDDEGKFQATLKKGIYTIEFRSLGYETVVQTIEVKDDTRVINVMMKETSFILNEITISNKEDPAYEIMRKAIQKAPYHLQKIQSYTAEAYIKGNMELLRVSKLVDKLSSSEGLKMSDFKKLLFVQESFNEIKFTYPDKYIQTVKAFSSTIPDNMDPKDAMGIMTTSLYSPTTSGGKITPLNSKAFKYYTFRYEGFLEENESVINKIKVTPRVNDPQLVSGYIYIADNSWDLRFAELSTNVYGVKQDFTVSYGELEAGLYLPISYNNRIDINSMGVEGFFNYFSSLKYLDVKIKNDTLISAKILPLKRDLNLGKDTLYSIKTDSLATKRDTLFWQKIRINPLSSAEIKSYHFKDSIQSKVDSLKKNYNNSKFKIQSLFFGGKIGGDSTRFTFKYGGALYSVEDYNFVDGLWIGQKFELSTKFNKKYSLKLAPQLHYTTARKTLVWKTDLDLQYAQMYMGALSLSVGSSSTDYNQTGVNRLDNALSSFF